MYNTGGDVIKDVGGNVIKVHGDLIYGEKDEKKIPLPRFVGFEAKFDGYFLRLTDNDGSLPAGFVKFEAMEVSPQAKFELERAKSRQGLVHIRCCYNGKYLVRSGTEHWLIVAAADKPEENTSNISCTLFEPELVNKSGGLEFRFRHVQLGFYACFWRTEFPLHGGLFQCSKTPDKYQCDIFRVIDLESLAKKMNKAKTVVLPRFMALKAINNNKYLSLTKNDPPLPVGFLKFEGDEAASPLAKFEVEKAKRGNGLVHIRCCFNNKYLVGASACWIVAAADKPNEDESKFSCTLFEPELYDESGGLEFRFRHVQLGKYACLWRAKIPYYGGLCGGQSLADQDACDVYTVVDLDRLE